MRLLGCFISCICCRVSDLSDGHVTLPRPHNAQDRWALQVIGACPWGLVAICYDQRCFIET